MGSTFAQNEVAPNNATETKQYNYYNNQRPSYISVQNNVPVPYVYVNPAEVKISIINELPVAPAPPTPAPAPTPASKPDEFSGMQVFVIFLALVLFTLIGLLIGYQLGKRRNSDGPTEIEENHYFHFSTLPGSGVKIVAVEMKKEEEKKN